MKSPSPRETSASVRFMMQAWFGLTANERWALLVVLGLFLLGLGARAWHLAHEHDAPLHPAPVSRPAEP